MSSYKATDETLLMLKDYLASTKKHQQHSLLIGMIIVLLVFISSYAAGRYAASSAVTASLSSGYPNGKKCFDGLAYPDVYCPPYDASCVSSAAFWLVAISDCDGCPPTTPIPPARKSLLLSNPTVPKNEREISSETVEKIVKERFSLISFIQ